MLHPEHYDRIHDLTSKLSKRWGVRLYRYANVGNHIHLLIRVPSRAIWQRFMRSTAHPSSPLKWPCAWASLKPNA